MSDFVDAVLRTKRRPLKVTAHIIVGLPWEREEDLYETAKMVAALPVDGIKIHPLYVMEHTPWGRCTRGGNSNPYLWRGM